MTFFSNSAQESLFILGFTVLNIVCIVVEVVCVCVCLSTWGFFNLVDVKINFLKVKFGKFQSLCLSFIPVLSY